MDIADFIRSVMAEELSDELRAQAKTCLKDIIATAAAATRLPLSQQALALTNAQYGKGPSPLWFSGKHSSLVGAAFYNALLTDSLDAHDGFRPSKGHVGATVIPVLLSDLATRPVAGDTLLKALVVGYEIASRAAMTIHEHYAPHYHSSGSWASLGASAAVAATGNHDIRNLDQLMGMTEYYAPISPIMRCVRNPSSLKDGAGAGAWAAAMAIAMEEQRFSGLPSIFKTEEYATPHLDSLGQRWYIQEQYFKAWPSCRWTHPVIECAQWLREQHDFKSSDIERVEVCTFYEGTALTSFPPRDSDAAQYSSPWILAAYLVRGKVEIQEVQPESLSDPEILAMGKRLHYSLDPECERAFPKACRALLRITLKNGKALESPRLASRGDPDQPLSPEELDAKFDNFCQPILGVGRSQEIANSIQELEKHESSKLVELISPST